MKRAVLGSVLAGLLVALAVAFAHPVLAHTELESTSPADGAALTAAPSQIDLVFGEAPMADAIEISITDSGGAVLATSLPATVADATVTAPWPAELTNGAYTINYRVVSDDGHPVSGSFSFTVGDATTTQTAGTVPASSSTGGVPARTLLIVVIAGVAIVVVAIVLVTRRNRDDQP